MSEHPRVAEPIDIASWTPDPEHPTFPEGKREKRAVICPNPAPHEALVPRHRYLYKRSLPRYPVEFWSEIVAYRVGKLIGVPVPPTYAAIDSRDESCGALVEWFYGKPDEPPQTKQAGGDWMTRLIPEYDRKGGKQHNFNTIRQLFEMLEAMQVVGPDWPVRWGEIFLLDALIGNRDRHQDNWGLIWKNTRRHSDPGNPSVISMAGPGEFAAVLTPAFDNGSSLGREFNESQVVEFVRGNRSLAAYVRRGRQHVKWDLAEDKQLNHLEFMSRYVDQFPFVVEDLRERLSFSEEGLRRSLQGLTELRMPCPLSQVRLEFIMKLIQTRKAQLTEILRVGS